MIYKNITELIGNTPMIKIENTNIFAKLEGFNPGGSVKDRIAYAMIKDALDRKVIDQDATIIEATSGNTGIGLSMVAATLGLKTIIVMPETMSVERRKLMRAHGAKLVLTKGEAGMKGAIAKAIELKEEIGNAFIPSQFENEANVKVHYETTGPEIYRDLQGKVDFLVAGIGTGGTITGAGKYLKENIESVSVVAVEPNDSAVLSGEPSGPHKIQGIGAGFVPAILDTKIYDDIIRVNNEDAFEYSRKFGKEVGYLVGISSGAALYAAYQISEKHPDKNIVVILPDTGERYLSTALYEDHD
ncbi:MAG: cysteine synthase A [Erysipelothrix sp.]|nr:cysteine synthase A [Erysipelothrix sp.]